MMNLKASKRVKTLALVTLPLLFLAPAYAFEKDRVQIPIHKPDSAGVPEGWRLKEWKGKASFKLVDSETGKTLQLTSDSTSMALYRDIDFDLKQYPLLNWRWKVTRLPEKGDVRRKNADDQAAQVYVVFSRWPEAVNSRLVGYIWDTTAPAGLAVTSARTSNVRYIVLKSGPEGLDRWFSEKRNVLADYKRLFNEEPPSSGKISVSVMIDSDNTGSSAESFIGDIFFSKETVSASAR